VGIQGLPQPQTNELGLSSFGNDQMCMKQMVLHYMGDPLAWEEKTTTCIGDFA
jgi:hypothetical protein